MTIERIMHQYVPSGNAVTAAALLNPWLYAVYGGLSVGIFDEVGSTFRRNYSNSKFKLCRTYK